MPSNDRFLPKGKQILPKICQVRLMPKARELTIGDETSCLIDRSNL